MACRAIHVGRLGGWRYPPRFPGRASLVKGRRRHAAMSRRTSWSGGKLREAPAHRRIVSRKTAPIGPRYRWLLPGRQIVLEPAARAEPNTAAPRQPTRRTGRPFGMAGHQHGSPRQLAWNRAPPSSGIRHGSSRPVPGEGQPSPAEIDRFQSRRKLTSRSRVSRYRSCAGTSTMVKKQNVPLLPRGYADGVVPHALVHRHDHRRQVKRPTTQLSFRWLIEILAPPGATAVGAAAGRAGRVRQGGP